VVCSKDISGLVTWFDVDYCASGWRLCIDSSNSSMKDVTA
jgi:hypothetical protein